jgi:c-di-AMP phosphodiesterase-like protein
MRRLMDGIASQLDPAQQEMLGHFPLPCIAVSDSGEILWYSDSFAESVLNGRELVGESFRTLTDLPPDHFCREEASLRLGARSYQVRGLHPGDVGMPQPPITQPAEDFYLLYFIDVTEMEQDALAYRQTRPSVMLIVLDNYKELMQKAKESEKSRILSAVDSLLEEFAGKMTTSFIRRYDGEQFMLIVEEQHLEKIIEGRFAVLDEVRKIQTGGLSVTLSIGVGRGEPTLAESENSARQALDMALGRGGDQVAVKNGTTYEFYGGVSKGVEKRTKVKSRMVANALAELIENADKVLVMGHKFGDLDCVGASAGMATAIRSMGKKAYVVLDREKNLSKTLIEMVKSDGNHDLFIDPDEALFTITSQTLLIICDTHTRNLVESQQVYERCKTVVVIDHHRKMVNHIENAVIFYHEPYASSASEMVTELVQYMGEKCQITSVVAQALLAGIMLDTRSFAMRTGVRTFEAAAYLRRIGADTVVVRKMFSNTMDSYQRKSRIVSNAQIYRKCAVAQSDFSSEDMRVVAPQAADELLSIDDVDASFVLYEISGTINISARSMGLINVQVIMEKMGGGGHQTMAATQLKGVEIEKAKQLLFESIDEYYTTH